jgi:uncharacterized membrane protein
MTELKDHPTITAEQKQNIQQHSKTVLARISSPLPPPEMLAGYERVQNGLIDTIIEMTEREGEHRRDLEKRKLQAEIDSMQRDDVLISRAQIFAFSLSILAILIGGIVGIYGAQITGSIIGTSGVVGIIVAFIKNSKKDYS